MEYRIERLGRQHYKDFAFLFSLCHGRSAGKDFFRRKIQGRTENPDHPGYIAFTADGMPVSVFVFYTCTMRYRNKNYPAAVAGDAMTHPGFRRQGLFDLLGRKTIALAKESGIKFLFCFPNQFTIPGSKKLGFEFNKEEYMQLFRIPVSTIPLSKICRKISFLDAAYRLYANTILFFFGKKESAFENSLAEENCAYVSHDKDFAQYKSYTCNRIIRAGGNRVWIKIDGELKIGDLAKKAGTDFRRLIKKLKRIAFFTGCSEIQFIVAKDSFVYEGLKDLHPHSDSFRIGRMDLGIDFPKEETRFTMADIDTF